MLAHGGIVRRMPKKVVFPNSPHGGNPGLLTEERQAKILEAIQTGVGWAVVAQYAGIGLPTLNEWRQRGKRYQAIMEGDADEVADLKAHRIWRKADEAWTSGRHQEAYRWLAELDAHTELSREMPYYRLKLAIDETLARTAVMMGATVLKGAREDPTLALKWLQSRFPQDWSPNRVAVPDDDVEERKHAALERLAEIRQERKANASTNGH